MPWERAALRAERRFGTACRNDPERTIEIDLAPRHVSRLATADRRQEQEAREGTGGVDVLGRPPQQHDLGIGQNALARRHVADEVRDLDQGAWIARDLLARHGVAEDRGSEREGLGRRIGA